MPRRRGALPNANYLEDGRLSCSSSPATAKTLNKSDPVGVMAIVNSNAIYGQNVEARIGFSMSDAAPTLSDSGYLHKKFKKLAATGGQGGTEEPKNPQGTGLGLLPTIAESSGSSGDREGSSSPVPEPNSRSGDGCEDWNRNNKPGRYVCSYCQHACAKPSVLEKHIRAHTNERPYPCLPCGFAFKTKSNLYKHRKSRTHVLKMEEITSAGSVPEEMSPPTDLSDENEASDEPEPELLPPLQVVPSSQTVQTSGSLESNPTDRFKTPYKPKFHTWKSVDESALNLLPKLPAGTEKFNPEPNDRTNPKFARSFSEVGRTNQEASLAPGGGVRPQLPSPGFLQARISQIISENQAIVETTDPIWNRRFVRQSSRDRDNPKSRSHVPKAPPPVQGTTNRERSCSFSTASSFEATNSSATLTAPSQSEEAMEELHRKRCLSEGRNSDSYTVRSLLQGSWQTEGKDQNPEGSLIKDLLLKSRMEASRSATNGTEASRAASLSFSVSAILQSGPELSRKSPGPSFQTLDRGAGAPDQGKDSPTAKRRKFEMSSPVRKDQQRTSVLLRSFSVDPGSISHGNSQKNEPRPSSALDYRPPQLSGLVSPFGSDSLWQQQLTQHPSRSSSLQLFGGEVEICEGDKKRVLRIDPSGFTPEPELPAFHVSPPTFTSGGSSSNQDSSVVVMISKSGLNTGGGTVQVHPANPVTRVITSAINIGSGSSITRRIETQSATAQTKPRIPYVPGIPGPYSSASALSPVAENPPTQSANSFVIPEITVSPADPETAAADCADSVNRSRFLRPNTLPLKPGTFQLKRTNMAGLEAGGKPHLVGSGAGMTLVSPETPRPHKLYRQMFLNGHAYTYLGLKCSTRVYFCCLSKPQPMYVQQMDTKLSMYSQWQTRPLPADSSPCGLNPVETMSLYDSRQHGSSYAVANPREGTRLILTHSSYWANRDRPLVSTTNSVAGGSASPPISVCEPEKQAEDKAEENGQQPAVYQPQEPKEPQPKRVRIFAGGFKSNEDYTYVRGRGRGRYVCEECGIRCKKPSMLKKHIRTHTDLRPYTCRQCNFSFKTKGNLTKHMKSKAHHKKCTELGILPVPTSVEEANIDEESLARQEKLKKSASGLAEDSEVDEEDDEDEDEEDDELDDEEEEMDCDSGSAEAVGQFEDADELPVQLPVPEVRGEREQEVARSLLDLGVIARAGSKPTTYPYNSCNNNNTGEKMEVVETPEAPPEVQESPPMDLSVARLPTDQLPIQEDPATILSPVTETSSLLASIYMTAQRAAEASGTGNSRSTPASAPEVPPENEMLQAYIKEKALKEGFIKRQQVKEIPARQVEDKPADPEPQLQTAGKEPQERVSVISSASSITQPPAAVVVCASGEGMVPKPRVESAASVAVQSQVFKMTDDGKTACSICNKVFTKPSQLRLHINIHYFERPFRCDSCAVSFRTKGHLQKHKRSVTHFNKVNMNLTFGTPSTENPRPFKCSDCMIAFRIHGHLAKHLRSKMHIMKLECLGKLPFGTYAEIERSGMNLNEIDTSDCHNSLESLQSLAHRLYRQDPSKLSQWQQQDASESSSAAACRERTVSGSSEEFSDLPDDADDDDDADDSDGIPCPDVTDSPRVDDSVPQPPTTPHSPPPPPAASHSPPPPPTAPHSPPRPTQLPADPYPADNSHWRTLPEAPRPFYPPAHVPMWPRTDGGYPSYVPPIRASPHWSQDPNAVAWMASRGIVLPIPVPGVSQMHGYVPGHLQLVNGGLPQVEETSYSCELCGKILVGKDALHQHMVTHAQPRPFVCEYCDAGFTTQQHLESHLSLHRQQQQQQQQSS